MNRSEEIAHYTTGMWMGLIEGQWNASDMKDFGQALSSNKPLKNLLQGSKRDKEIGMLIVRNFHQAVQVMLSYVEEQKAKAETAEAASRVDVPVAPNLHTRS